MVALYAAGQLHPVMQEIPAPPAGTINLALRRTCVSGAFRVCLLQQAPNPRIPREDADRACELCKLANDRFQNEIGEDKHGGAVVFGGCTVGAQGSKDLCAYNLSAEINSTFCNTPAQTSSINWPQTPPSR
jgi:hypothetical protein